MNGEDTPSLDDERSPAKRERRKEHRSAKSPSSNSGSGTTGSGTAGSGTAGSGSANPIFVSHAIGEEHWGLLQVLVGDYKTFVWNAKIQKVYELGAKETTTSEDIRQGRLGRVFNADCPDLRDLRITLQTLTLDDMLIVLPDHVTKSFDPEALGYSPRDVIPSLPTPIIESLPTSFPLTWEELGLADTHILKNQFKCTYVYNLLQQQYQQRQAQKHKNLMTPKVAVNAILSHCQLFYSQQYHNNDQHNGLCFINENGECSIINNEIATLTSDNTGSVSLCRRGCIGLYLQQLEDHK
eukprot:TRINITY_DN3257_c0_g1_i1.p1 TRINITY_DN3257_c0_g1~~TRINITY_DN3257_c0_g1_i1.p1  ORF type:complete len:338 (-),score=66.39 TRINITY_DN3257_c0_g1_i1:42-929(-)